jgi:hypothetical protein
MRRDRATREDGYQRVLPMCLINQQTLSTIYRQSLLKYQTAATMGLGEQT